MEYGWHQLPTIECLEKPSNRILLANAEPEKMSWMDSPSHTPRNEAGTGIYLHVAPSSDPLHLAGCVPSVASSPSLPLWRLSTYLKEPGDNSWESGWSIRAAVYRGLVGWNTAVTIYTNLPFTKLTMQRTCPSSSRRLCWEPEIGFPFASKNSQLQLGSWPSPRHREAYQGAKTTLRVQVHKKQGYSRQMLKTHATSVFVKAGLHAA